ncbi:MAG: hypothetical protein V3V18_03305 [Methylococcales bacterium]
MRISNRTLFSTGTALFALSLAVHADVILRSDSRGVSAGFSVTTSVASGEFTEDIGERIDSLGDFSPFNADVNANFSDGDSSVNVTADQSSEVTLTSISGQGSANANVGGSLEDSYAIATSSLTMNFELTSPTDYRLTGNVDEDEDEDPDFVATSEVRLSSSDGSSFTQSLTPELIDQIPLDFAGILPAGSYTIYAFASADIFSGDPISSAEAFSFLLEFPNESITVDPIPDPIPIPIPGAALLFGSGLLALLGRLRFRNV